MRKYNIATIEHVLSSKFIAECVTRSRHTTLDHVAIDLQYAFNEQHHFSGELLVQPEHNVSISKVDVERALALHNGRSTKTDEIGLVYNWLMDTLSMMVHPNMDKAWAKFVAHAKETRIMGLFAHLTPKEVYRLFQAVYAVAAPKAVTAFYM
jgi:hypothetical protein